MSTIKLPILKKGEYDVWAMKMEHYLAHTDYPLWEVIQKGNGPVNVSTDTHGIMKVLPPKTAEETLARERERKARTTLLLALPEDHLAKFHKMTDAKEMWEAIKSRFGGNEESKKNKANDNSKRLGKKEESNTLMTLDGGCVDWTSHSEEEEDYALMACNSSGSDTKVTSCSKECKESYAKLKKLYDEQRAQLSDASIEIQAYTQALKKLEAQLVTHQQSQLWYEAKIRYDGILSYENEVLQSVFMNKESDLEYQPLYDRFVTAEGMHDVPPPITGNYMPSGPDIEIDYPQFTYGPKQSQTSESETQTSDFDTCESDCSVETHESLPEPNINEPKVVSQPKVWSDAPIIEEYESDSKDEHASLPTEEQETLSFANKQVKTHRETVKNQFTQSKNPKVDKKGLGYGPAFNNTTALRTNFSKQKVNTAEVNAVSAVGGIGKTAVKPSAGCNWRPKRHYWHKISKYNGGSSPRNCATFKDLDFRHMTRNKAYLAEYQDFNRFGLFAFGDVKVKWFKRFITVIWPELHIQNGVALKKEQDLLLLRLLNYASRSENQANKHAGQQEANQNAGTEENIDAGDSPIEAESAQDYFVLPIWSSYSSTVKDLLQRMLALGLEVERESTAALDLIRFIKQQIDEE
ncbi:hypothetical protein Tco_0702950 [Tanacetum coccineum]|uniref:Uncharacterized protein n=1 Tax=Tanacetum coccineum TaxID=301880 RepID=A0ABQ4XXN1_9ASTR